LGGAYEHGRGVTVNFAQAAAWYLKAAEQGDAFAQYQLGLLYEEGNGVPQSHANAYFWLDLAAAGKPIDARLQEAAAKNRDDAASHLSSTDLVQTQERTRKWFEDHPVQANQQ
jgi:TPR repeat protein